MPEVEHVKHHIDRTAELAEELKAAIKDRRLNIHQVARRARVDYKIVFSMLHPERPGRVSKESGSAVIETLAWDRQQAFNLFTKAGIGVYRLKGSRRLEKLL